MTVDWWTLGLQTVNLAVLVWLLQCFFWRPVAAMIEQRRDKTRQVLADAETARAEAAAALAEIEKTRAGFREERDAILAAARESAEKAQAARLAETGEQLGASRLAAKAEIETEKLEAEKSWADQAGSLAIDIAKRLAARLDGAAVRAAFLEWLLQSIATLPETERQAAMDLEAVSATALDPDEQKQAGESIAKAFGGHPTVAFKTDPTLIAGLELHGPHLLISNSWRADLSQILAGLTHEK